MNLVNIDPEFASNVAKIRDRLQQDFALAVAVDAIRYAPVDTGLLASRIEPTDDGKQVVAKTHYAAPVEFGHRVVVDGHDTGKYVPAQPYLRPACYKHRDLS